MIKSLVNPTETRTGLVSENDVYVFNPFYRLRNGKDNVLAFGIEGFETYHLHRTVGIILALCNGERTVGDLARITRPLVKLPNDVTALQVSRRYVTDIVSAILDKTGDLPSSINRQSPTPSLLVAKTVYDQWQHRYGFRKLEYDAGSFLPKNRTEINQSPDRAGREPSPLSINWHLHSQRPMDCRQCSPATRSVSLLPRERVLELINEAAEIGTLSVSLSGSDILDYPHLAEMLQLMHDRHFLPAILSTKSFLARTKARELAAFPGMVSKLEFRVDPSEYETTDYQFGESAYMDRLFGSISNAREAGLRTCARVIIRPHNLLAIPTLYQDLKRHGIDEIKLTTSCRRATNHFNNTGIHAGSLALLLQELRREWPIDNISFRPRQESQCPRFQSQIQDKTHKSCTAGQSGMLILPDGKVLPCEQFPQAESYFCGDLRHQSIQEVWNSERMRSLTGDFQQ